MASSRIADLRSARNPCSPLLAVVLLATASCTVAVEQGTSPPDAASSSHIEVVRDLARDAVEAGSVAGVSIAVERDSELQLAEGFGFADLENDVPATADTVYRIGSITKQFTAALVLQLVEEGEVDLDADFRRWVDYPTGDRVVTVAQLLNHTSGIASYTSQGERFRRGLRLDLEHEQLLDLVRDLPFDFEPGTQWSYNNTGYYLLGMLIENVTGQTYAEALDARIATPLGLTATTYCDERRLIENRAEGYERVDGELLNDEPLSMRQPFAAGALCSTVSDLLAWQAALESGGVVSESSYRAMVTPLTLSDGSPLTYGYGLGVNDLEGHARIAHGGGINGFVTMLARFPDDDLRVVVLTNTPGPTAGELTEKIARLYLGL